GDAKVARYHLLDVATNRERFVSDETFLPSSLQPGSAHSPPVPRPLPVRFTSDSRRVVLMTLPPREGTPAEALLVVVDPEREPAVGPAHERRSSEWFRAPGAAVSRHPRPLLVLERDANTTALRAFDLEAAKPLGVHRGKELANFERAVLAPDGRTAAVLCRPTTGPQATPSWRLWAVAGDQTRA